MTMRPFLNHQMLKQVLSGPGGMMNVVNPYQKTPLQPPPAPMPGPGLGRLMHRLFGKQAAQTGGTY